jgi:hypothetical protein
MYLQEPAGGVGTPGTTPGRPSVCRSYGDENVASGFFAAFILNEHAPVPEQTTPQPLKVEPAFADAESATLAPFATIAVQFVVVHVKLTGVAPVVPAIVPLPVPLNDTVRG